MALKLFELLGADDRRFTTYSWRGRMLDFYDGLARSVTAYPE